MMMSVIATSAITSKIVFKRRRRLMDVTWVDEEMTPWISILR